MARLVVRLTPRAEADRIDGWAADEAGRPVLKARVRASPVDGKANAALERLLADALGLAPSRVRLSGGGSSRLKTLQVEGLAETDIKARLGAPH